MRFWLTKRSSVPVREQLSAQFKLGILSAELQPGHRLPSTRELARRLRIHPNTVSAVYGDLATAGWVERRRGSGIYVRPRQPHAPDDGDLDNLIPAFLRAARAAGHTLAAIESRFAHWIEVHPPDHLLVIDPDPVLRELLAAELRASTGLRVEGASIEEARSSDRRIGALVVALSAHEAECRAALPSVEVVSLRVRSVAELLAGERRPAPEELVTVVSQWPQLLDWARAILTAAGVEDDALDLRLAQGRNWQRGLRAASILIADAATAQMLPPDCRPRVYRIIADASIEDLRARFAV